MLSAASGALEHLFRISANDKVLILSDDFSASVAEAFHKASSETGCVVDSYKIESSKRPLKEIPDELENLLPGKTIVLNIIKSFPEEISFRIKWIFKVEENKLIKMGHMPGITEDLMYNSVNVDFNRMETTAVKLIKKLENAVRLHITTDAGTDIMLGIAGRKFIGDIGVTPGKMCNIPCGEIYTAPLETEANGVIVFDASLGDIGLLKDSLKVYVSRGKITKFESSNEELVKKITGLTDVDDDAKVIGELGIGVNPGARITGNMLEDEKSLGTAHIAFGNNADFPCGGKNNSKIHRDFLFYRPTIEIYYPDDSKKLLMKHGNFIF
jgi:leucyl aminopeptidase (aminopeptidase T)